MVVIETLVLNGYRGLDEVFGNLSQLHPYPVFLCIEGLHLYIFSRPGILVVHRGGKLGRIVRHIQPRLGDDDILNIHR